MPEPMLCPIDKTPLVMSERQNIEIDYCPTCRGVWLDRGELDKIIERSAEASTPAPAAAPPPPPQPHATRLRGSAPLRPRPPRPRLLRQAQEELPRGAVRLSSRLFTIGYEGKTIDEFLGELAEAGVRLLIDVRAVAASRRPGFSKTALAGALAERGIGYVHLRALGTPKAGREAARKGRIAEMREIYEGQLETPEAELALEQARSAARETPSALLCFEAEASACHRAVVAERLDEFETVNL